MKSAIGQVLTPLIRGICYYPDVLEVQENHTPIMTDLLYLPHMSDYGLICGKDGRQIRAFRYLSDAIARRGGYAAVLNISESYKGDRNEGGGFVPNQNFDLNKVIDLMDPIMIEACGKAFPCQIFNDAGRTMIAVDAPEEFMGVIMAMADCFYPYGFRNGKKFRIRSKNYKRGRLLTS